jgi:hypothetical protein
LHFGSKPVEECEGDQTRRTRNSPQKSEVFTMKLLQCEPVSQQGDSELLTEDTNGTPRSANIKANEPIGLSSFKKQARHRISRMKNDEFIKTAVENLTRYNAIAELCVDIDFEDES